MKKAFLATFVYSMFLCAASGLFAHDRDGRRPGDGSDGDGTHRPRDGDPRPLPCFLEQFDADGDGVLNESEQEAARAGLEEIRATYDADGDGRLSCEERNAAIAALCPDVEGRSCDERPRHPLPCFLEEFDPDGDGTLNEEERAAAQARIDEVRAHADADGDGVVTREEVRAALESLCGEDDEEDEETVQVAAQALGAAPAVTFARSDADANGSTEISDSIGMLRHLFLGALPPTCLDASDSNDDGVLDLSDAVFSLAFLFLGGQAPPAPFPTCGEDLTADRLDCDASLTCNPN